MNRIHVIAPMSFGNSQKDVPEGQMKIAQRFNAGLHATPAKVPKGRLNGHPPAPSFGRPFGTRIRPTTFPALKRWAIVRCPSGTNFRLSFRKALGPAPRFVCSPWGRRPERVAARARTVAILIVARRLETLSANLVGHFVEKSTMSQNSSTKCFDKVGDEAVRTAIMGTATRTETHVVNPC